MLTTLRQRRLARHDQERRQRRETALAALGLLAILGDGFAGRIYAKARRRCDTLGRCKATLCSATALNRWRSLSCKGVAMTSTATALYAP